MGGPRADVPASPRRIAARSAEVGAPGVTVDGKVAVLRDMRWWDIDPVMALELELFGDEAWSPTMFWSELAEHATRHYLVATSDQQGVAYAGLCAYPPHESYVQTIAVAPAAQGQGLGTRLLTALIDESQRRGCRRLDLEVRADNDVAVALY